MIQSEWERQVLIKTGTKILIKFGSNYVDKILINGYLSNIQRTIDQIVIR